MKKPILMLALATAALTGCVADSSDYETKPVTINTPEGKVTCQLYTKRFVKWDKAIRKPADMTFKRANDICFDLGYKWQQNKIDVRDLY